MRLAGRETKDTGARSSASGWRLLKLLIALTISPCVAHGIGVLKSEIRRRGRCDRLSEVERRVAGLRRAGRTRRRTSSCRRREAVATRKERRYMTGRGMSGGECICLDETRDAAQELPVVAFQAGEFFIQLDYGPGGLTKQRRIEHGWREQVDRLPDGKTEEGVMVGLPGWIRWPAFGAGRAPGASRAAWRSENTAPSSRPS